MMSKEPSSRRERNMALSPTVSREKVKPSLFWMVCCMYSYSAVLLALLTARKERVMSEIGVVTPSSSRPSWNSAWSFSGLLLYSRYSS